MPKCDACGERSKQHTYMTPPGELCYECAESFRKSGGSVFDWCIARHDELQAKQPATKTGPVDEYVKAMTESSGSVVKLRDPKPEPIKIHLDCTRAAQPSPTDAELIALAGLAQAEVVALAVSSEASPPHQPASMSEFYVLPSFAALCAALKSRGVIK